MSWNVQWVLSPSLSVSATDSPGVIDSSVCVSSTVLRASALYLCTSPYPQDSPIALQACTIICDALGIVYVLSDACALNIAFYNFYCNTAMYSSVFSTLYLCTAVWCGGRLGISSLFTHCLSSKGRERGSWRQNKPGISHFVTLLVLLLSWRKKTFVLQVISIYFS